LENARINLDLLDTGAIELFECCDNACLLASTRGSVYEKVWEITALSLIGGLLELFIYGCEAILLTRALRRSESSGW
jgi:hypothetical protein